MGATRFTLRRHGFLPEVGDEVLVAFAQGDPQRITLPGALDALLREGKGEGRTVLALRTAAAPPAARRSGPVKPGNIFEEAGLDPAPLKAWLAGAQPPESTTPSWGNLRLEARDAAGRESGYVLTSVRHAGRLEGWLLLLCAQARRAV